MPPPTSLPVFATIALTPSWWTKVRRDASGAIPMAIQIALRAIMKTDLEILEFRAEADGLFLVAKEPVDDALPDGGVDAWKTKIVRTIESEITIEASDYRDEADAAPSISRAELEDRLRALGLEHDDEADATGTANRSLWTLSTVGSASCYVRLTRIAGQPPSFPNDNLATWGDARGEREMNYASVAAKLAEFEAGGMIDPDKSARGGVFDEPERARRWETRLMGIVDAYVPPTREVEEILREHDFEARNPATPHVWTNPEGTKFLAFPEGEVKPGTEATAIYGDAERGEPGVALTFRQAKAVVSGAAELDSPELRRLALPPPKTEPARALPEGARPANVIEGEFEDAKPPATD